MGVVWFIGGKVVFWRFIQFDALQVVADFLFIGNKWIEHQEGFLVSAEAETYPVDQIASLGIHEGFNQLAASVCAGSSGWSGLCIFNGFVTGFPNGVSSGFQTPVDRKSVV